MPTSSFSRGALAAPARTLVDVLAETVGRHPDARAIDDGNAALSYRELAGAVEQTAARLTAAGVGRGDRVGIRIPSGTLDLYVSILGVLSVGAAYVPVDNDDPDERARLVFDEAQVAAVLGADSDIRRRTPAHRPAGAPGPLRARISPRRR